MRRGLDVAIALARGARGVLVGLPVSGGWQLTGVALLGLAMVSTFPYAKLPRLVKLPPWLWVLPVVGAFVDVPGVFAFLVTGYLLSGPLLWLWFRQVGRTA